MNEQQQNEDVTKRSTIDALNKAFEDFKLAMPALARELKRAFARKREKPIQ